MTTYRTALAVALPLALGPATALAQRTPAHERIVALGTRLVGQSGDYTEGGLGGQLRLQVHRLVTVELFTDQFIGVVGGALRHDHEVGGTLQINVLRGRRGEIFPFLGACASLAMLESPQGGPAAMDVRAGPRAGVGGLLDLWDGFALEASLEAVMYIGHSLNAYRWTAGTGSDITAQTVGQLTVAINYAF